MKMTVFQSIGRRAVRRAAVALPGVLLATALCAALSGAAAQGVQRIAAIVNDEVISGYDLEQRVGLIVATSGGRLSDEALSRIRDQVLRTLIDERLQLQEASRLGLNISEGEIDTALKRIMTQNGTTVEAVTEELSNKDVGIDTLRSQVHAEITWRRLVSGRFRSQAKVGDEEIALVLDRMEASTNTPQFLLSEIFLGIDAPEQEEAVRASAQNLAQEVARGAPFDTLAEQFSQAPSAASGGDMGWVEQDQLPVEIAKTLETMNAGELKGPIRASGGYYILRLHDRRILGGGDPLDTQVVMLQAVMPVKRGASDAAVAKAQQAAEKISRSIGGCSAVQRLPETVPGVLYGDVGNRKLRDLSPEFMAAVRHVRAGQASRPVRSRVGFHVMVVCRRLNEVMEMPTADEVRNNLENQQLAMMARRYLRDLRRDATVEMR